MKLILASSSPFRKQLLARLNLPFECIAPHIDESEKQGEDHSNLVERLSFEKAHAIHTQYPDSICIGCDTIASLGSQILGKSYTLEAAVEQIKQMRSKVVTFYTGVCVLSPGQKQCTVIPSEVVFRDDLSDEKIRRYCELEQPFYSSGSFKSETSACNLIQRLTSDDPTAIIGLPLIALSQMLEKAGITIL